MAITINAATNPSRSATGIPVVENSGQPSALLQVAEVNVDLDAAYPAGGYDLSGSFAGAKVQPSPFHPSWDGAALYFLRAEDDSGTPKLVVYDSANGEPTTETVTADQSGHTGKRVMFLYK